MIHAVRGTYDVLPGDIEIWHAVEARIRKVFHSYGFQRDPDADPRSRRSFSSAASEKKPTLSRKRCTRSSIATAASLSLRPEGTAPVIRAYIEHQLQNEARMMKLYYIAPDVSARTSAEGTIPSACAGGRRSSLQHGQSRDRGGSHRDAAVLFRRSRYSGSRRHGQFHRSPGMPRAVPSGSEEGNRVPRRVACARTAGGVAKRIRCACSIARFLRASP